MLVIYDNNSAELENIPTHRPRMPNEISGKSLDRFLSSRDTEFASRLRRCPSDTVEAARNMRENIRNPPDVPKHFSEVRPDLDVRHPLDGHLPPVHHAQRHPPVHHPLPVSHDYNAHATTAQLYIVGSRLG